MSAILVLSGAMLSVTPAHAQYSAPSTTNTATTNSTTASSTRTNGTPATVSVPAATSLPNGNQVTPSPDIIPRPGSGQQPRDPGDRGGWWQESLFFLMCGAVLVIIGLVWRDSRRARRRQGRLGPRSGKVARSRPPRNPEPTGKAAVPAEKPTRS